MDAVLAAQAWHWVDPARAVPEVARVLSPGGTLGLAWNERDEREPWVAELGRIIGEARREDGEDDGEDNTSDHPRVGPPFSPLERHDVPWVHQVTLPGLLDMVASRSYAILLPAQQRQVLLDRVRQLAQTHPAVAGQPGISLPYITQCWRGSPPLERPRDVGSVFQGAGTAPGSAAMLVCPLRPVLPRGCPRLGLRC